MSLTSPASLSGFEAFADAPDDTLRPLHALRAGDSGRIARLLAGPVMRELPQRLSALGFKAGRRVHVVATGPWGGSPWAVEVGGRIFALRRHEAARILLAAE
jgi:ferrous iron transport protein A